MTLAMKGMALIEVVLAMGIGLIVIFGGVQLATSALRTSTINSTQFQANKLVSQEIDRVTLYRDSQANWADFLTGVSGCSVNCYTSVSGSTINIVVGTVTTATLEIPITYYFTAKDSAGGAIDSNDKSAVITVFGSWGIAGRTQTTQASVELTSWRDFNAN